MLTSWNGLVVGGLAKAGILTGRQDWIDAATGCVDFIREMLWDGERLAATWAVGSVGYAGYLDDYANLLTGLSALLSARWRQEDARFALALAETALKDFQASQGLETTGVADAATVAALADPKPVAEPAGGFPAVAAELPEGNTTLEEEIDAAFAALSDEDVVFVRKEVE